MSSKQLSDYTVYSKYAHYLPDKKRRETWPEMVDRVFAMHTRKFADVLSKNEEFAEMFEFAKGMVLKRRVLGSQRALQFGGKSIEKENIRMFNCSATYVDRPRVFQEIMYVLLCGAGVGLSIQKHHVHKLPDIAPKTQSKKKTFTPEDTIAGWADAIGVMVGSYFKGENDWDDFFGYDIEFDLSKIRPKGSLVAGQFKAPGPEPLAKALKAIKGVVEARINSEQYLSDEFAGKLRPIDCHDIVMHSSEGVLAGSVRRSACISIFSPDDEEMMKAKTGDWHVKNPQRARANNSILVVSSEIDENSYHDMFRYVREYGEPGIIHSPSTEVIFNPCVEISLVPFIDGESGFAKCNLTEINGRYCDNKNKFFECCRASAILGTMQAVYTDFHYLTDVTKRIVEKEALLGCSITGIMDNSEILLDPDIQVAGAKIIKETNEKVAKMLGINSASRLTTAKPAGSTSVLLQTASGIHPHHSRRYLRRVQANKMEFSARYYQKANPSAVENSVWSANDSDLVISFACEVPPGAILKNQIGAIEFLEMIKATRANWIEAGTRDWLSPVSGTRHNVSCTVVVKDDEWDDVEKYVYKNKQYFGGISFLPFSGDLDYSQAPFASILTPREMVDEYGDASVLGSGLVVDGLSAFDGDLWAACSTSLGYGEKLDDSIEEPVFPVRNGKTLKEHNVALVSYYQNKNKYDNWFLKKDWIRRVRQFADRYFDGNLTKCTYCLKHLALWHKWLELKRTIKPIDWATIVEDDRELVGVDTLGAQACSGGACEIL